MSSLIRSRWAAIGAAVAVTLGAGGLITASAASEQSVFVAIEPVRILDTRINVGLGLFTSEQPQDLRVIGIVPAVVGNTVFPSGVVPDGATAIVANVTAVTPTTGGFVSVRPSTATGKPTTSNINFTTGGVIEPNSVTVEVPTTGSKAGKVQLWFKGTNAAATTHMLLDVVGYYVPGGAGTPGPKGDTGAKGTTGATGPSGLSFVTSYTSALFTPTLNSSLDKPANYTLERALTAGRYFVSGDLTLRNYDPATKGDVFCQFFVDDVVVGAPSQISVVASGRGNIAISQTFEIPSDTAPIGLGMRCRENGGSTDVRYYSLNMTLFKVG